MTTSTITSVTLPKQADTFVSLGKTIADTSKKHYGALVKFSALLVETFGADWHAVKASDPTPNGVKLREVKDKLYAQLKAAQHSNPAKVWADLREYAVRQNAIAAVSGAGAEQSEQDGGGEGGEGGKSETSEKTLEQKIAGKLAEIRKMIAKQDIKSALVKKCDQSILRAMMALEPTEAKEEKKAA
jgi:hypothetical protein